jgi:hypothetical protein
MPYQMRPVEIAQPAVGPITHQFCPECDTVRVVSIALDCQVRLLVGVFEGHTLHGAETHEGSMQVHTVVISVQLYSLSVGECL